MYDAFVSNQSVPSCTVIPVLAYEDADHAAMWLCETFGFVERLRIGNHRVQLLIGEGAVIVTDGGGARSGTVGHGVHVRVADVDRHFERAQEHGAQMSQPPTTYPFGERQYTIEDPGGHRWTFSQSIADIPPEEWGAVVTKHDEQQG